MIEGIRSKIGAGLYEYSKHAVDQSILRNISIRDLVESIENGIIIEDYPEDKYGPSCLIFGFTAAGRPLHIQCTTATRDMIKIVTLYEPDADKWIDYRYRRQVNEG